MKTLRSLFVVIAITMVLLGVTSAGRLSNAIQAAPDGSLLTGTIKSAAGAKMGGVTVSAKGEGKTITTTVFTDEQGNYYFPPMDSGKYQVWAQAGTFETARAAVELSATSHQNFVMKPLKDFERQLTGDQILAALPEDTLEDKRLKHVFRNNCTACHQPNYILQNRFDKDGWVAIMNFMRDTVTSGNYNGEDSAADPIIEYFKDDLAAYLAKVRGPGPTAMKFKLRPRPTGEAARAVFTEYDVPLDPSLGLETEYPTNSGSDWSLGTPSMLNGNHGVHDAQNDFEGNIWFSNSVTSRDISVGRIDAKTGEVRYLKVPGQHGNAATGHALVRDAHGILWLNLIGTGPNGQGSLASLDPKTEKFQIFPAPKTMNGTSVDVDGKGKIWVTAVPGALRLDPDTGKFSEFNSVHFLTPMGNGRPYGVAGDSLGNGWWSEMALDIVGHGDTETGKSSEVVIPPVPGIKELYTAEQMQMFNMTGNEYHNSLPWVQGPRRMAADKNGDYVWVCDFWGGTMAKIDIRTQKSTLVPLPNPETQQPYQAAVDSNHNAWTNLMNTDQVLKYDVKTSKWTQFQLPSLGTETRYMSIDEHSGTLQVILPYFRTRKIARMTLRSPEEIQALQKQVQLQQQASAR
jgi:streptogramin lyase/mono/diheme cytochrome c family protein